MKTMLAAVLLGTVGTAVVAAPALAAPPEPSEFSYVSTTCGFPVEGSVTGRVKVITHGDLLITVAPQARATFTNPANGATLTVNLGGAFHEQVQPNGDLVGTATGHNVFGGPVVGTILYTTGPVSYVQDAETGVVTITSPSRTAVDVCQQLA